LPKILVTGARGQLAKSIKNLISKVSDDYEFTFTSKEKLDITNQEDINLFFNKNQFEFCVNCAAYTNVKQAEITPEKAFKVNTEAVKYLAIACNTSNTTLIHISTDYVFDGNNRRVPYLETDKPNPINEYGKSKLAGEHEIKTHLEKYFIIRTSWLYSEYGNNFVKTMLQLSKEKDQLSIVNNQIGCPTYTKDLANVILKIIKTNSNEFGIYHYSNSGQTSWYNFAKTVFEIKNIKIDLNPINLDNPSHGLKRPLFSVLDTNKIERTFSITIPNWKVSLKQALSNLDDH